MSKVDNNAQSASYVNSPATTTTNKRESNFPVSVWDRNNNGIVDREDLQGVTVEHPDYGKIDLATLCENIDEFYGSSILGSLWSKLKDKFDGSGAIKDESGNITDYKTDYINPETNQKMSVLDICAELVKFQDKRNAERGKNYAIGDDDMEMFASTFNISMCGMSSSRMGDFGFIIDDVYEVAFPGATQEKIIHIENTLTGETFQISEDEFYAKYKL